MDLPSAPVDQRQAVLAALNGQNGGCYCSFLALWRYPLLFNLSYKQLDKRGMVFRQLELMVLTNC